MQRRSFLMLAAGATTASAMQKPPVGIGFLGAVHSHFEGKLASARAIPDLHVVGVCEQDADIRGSLQKQGVPVLTREALLQHPDIQIIAVESAVRDHARDGLAVLEAGKHLHLEKAPADTMSAFKHIVDTARRNKLQLQVGYIFRRHSGINKAEEAARKGWLGDIYMVRANIGNQLAKDRRPEWAEFPGGVMFELGGHVIDPLVRLMGLPRKVTASLHKDGAFADTLMDNTVALLEWEKATGIVQSATLQHASSRYRSLEVYGTKGCVIVNPLEPGAVIVDLEKPAGPYVAGLQKLTLPPFKRYGDDLLDLVAAVRGEAPLPVTFEQDLMVHEALLRCSGMYA